MPLGESTLIVDSTRDRDPEESRASILRAAFVVCLLGFALAVYARYASPLRPGVTSRLGFNGFFDQSEYLKTAKLLSHFHLPSTSAQYRYGLGYPIAAVPFLWIGFHGDPFGPVDALTFGATASLTFVLATRLPMLRSERARIAAGLSAAAISAVATPLLALTSIPWNTSITIPLTLLVLVICTSARQVSYKTAIALGVAVGWIFAARYADAAFVGLPIVALVFARSRRERKRIIIGGGGALFIVVVLVLYTHLHAFGNPFTTPYQSHLRPSGANDQSFAQYRLSNVPHNFIGTFLSGLEHGKRVSSDPILRQFPLLWLAPLGAIVVIRTRSRDRAVWITMIVTSLLVSVFYLSFIAGDPGDLHFGNTRYWAAWYPLWSVLIVACAAAGLEHLMSRSARSKSRAGS